MFLMGGIFLLFYLIVFGFMLVISVYMFLLKNVCFVVVISYVYVNLVVVVLLGIGFVGESLFIMEWCVLVVIVFVVVLVMLGKFLFKLC